MENLIRRLMENLKGLFGYTKGKESTVQKAMLDLAKANEKYDDVLEKGYDIVEPVSKEELKEKNK